MHINMCVSVCMMDLCVCICVCGINGVCEMDLHV